MSFSCALLAIALTLQAEKPFVSVAGGFEVKLPGKPKESTRKVPYAPFDDLEVHLALVEKGQISNLVEYNDYPVSIGFVEADITLERVLDETIKESKATLLGKKNIRLGNVPGKEYEFTMPLGLFTNKTCRGRVYLDGLRLYRVAVQGQAKDVSAPEATAFLDSFKLTGKDNKAQGQIVSMPVKQAQNEMRRKPTDPSIYVSEKGRFELKLPRMPVEHLQRLGTVDNKIELHVFLVDMGATAYYAAYQDCQIEVDDEDIPVFLDMASNGGVQALKGKLLVKKNIHLGNVPGQEVEFTTMFQSGITATGRLRVYLDKKRVYIVVLMSSTDLATSPAGTSFLDSFKITKPK